MDDAVSFLDQSMFTYLDTFRVVLVECAQGSLLPELCEVFEGKTLIDFLNVFAGSTFTVPSKEALQKIVLLTSLCVETRAHPDRVPDAARRAGVSTTYARALREAVQRRFDEVPRGRPRPKPRRVDDGSTDTP